MYTGLYCPRRPILPSSTKVTSSEWSWVGRLSLAHPFWEISKTKAQMTSLCHLLRKLKPELLGQQNRVPEVCFFLLVFVLKTWFNHLHAHHRAKWPVHSPAVQHQAWRFIAGEVWRHVFFHCLQKCWPCTVSICQTKYINRLKKVTLESIHSQGFVLFLTWWHTKTSEIEQEGNQTALNKEEEKKNNNLLAMLNL